MQDKDRLNEVIRKHKEITQKDIKETSLAMGFLLREHSKITKTINKNSTLLNIYNKRAEALKTLTSETFYTEYFDKYFDKWDEVEFCKELINKDIILGYLTKTLDKKDFAQVEKILNKENK